MYLWPQFTDLTSSAFIKTQRQKSPQKCLFNYTLCHWWFCTDSVTREFLHYRKQLMLALEKFYTQDTKLLLKVIMPAWLQGTYWETEVSTVCKVQVVSLILDIFCFISEFITEAYFRRALYYCRISFLIWKTDVYCKFTKIKKSKLYSIKLDLEAMYSDYISTRHRMWSASFSISDSPL